MEVLIELFWSKYTELRNAVERNDTATVEKLDRELSSLLDSIFQSQAWNSSDINRQFRLAIDLLNEEADDLSCVRHNSRLIQSLVERYISTGDAGRLGGDAGGEDEAAAEEARVAAFNAAMLDNISERVAVVAPGYRLSYTNAANANRHHSQPSSLIGRHFAEVIGFQRFQNGFKEHLDRCFAGETVAYTYAEEVEGRTVVVRCRMSPYYSGGTTPSGVMLVMRETADRRRSSAA